MSRFSRLTRILRMTFCNFLKAETEKVKRKIREVAKEDVEDKLLEACGYLGSYSDACRATVVDNFDAIYRYVQNPFLIATSMHASFVHFV